MTRSEILQTAKPIRFSTEMVRAIQDGRKTVARRRIKQSVVDRFMLSNDGRLLGSFDDKCYDIYPTVDDAPYQVDDILYVRETWGRYSICEGIMPTIYYKANGNAPDKIKWISSIHMPKEAARIFLRVTDVRVERLQDITEEQAICEGCNGLLMNIYRYGTAPSKNLTLTNTVGTPTRGFGSLSLREWRLSKQ